MLLTRLPRPQLLSPAWTACKLLHWGQRAPKSSARGNGAEKRTADGQTLTLFEELFPEESKKAEHEQKTTETETSSQGPPRDELLREFEWAKSMQFRPSSKEKTTVGDFKRLSLNDIEEPDTSATKKEYQSRERQDASVLALSNASKSLSLSDFLRLSPKGEHIDGWASGIIKVIPGRDPNTLEAGTHYFILFSTDAAAHAYSDRIHRLHWIGKNHASNSTTWPLPPPPGLLRHGEDLRAVLQDFTLVPLSHDMPYVRLLKKPLRPSMQRVVAEGNHPVIAGLQKDAVGLVLLAVDRGQLGVGDVRAAIGRDGKARNLQWSLVAGGDDVVRVQGRKLVRGEETEEESQLEGDERERERARRRLPPRFIVSFKDQLEARRFVRAWHRRPFPLSPSRPQSPIDDTPPIVDAELLW